MSSTASSVVFITLSSRSVILSIGHVRYTTAGSSSLSNVQPFYAQIYKGQIAIAHNGNLINTTELKRELIKKGAIFSSNSDTEIVLHLIARESDRYPKEEAVIRALQKLKGAFSLLIMFEDMLFAVRDPYGFRPLVLGRLQDGITLASETCAFELINAVYEREIEPGEVVVIDKFGNPTSFFPFPKVDPKPCIFECIYFARPDSVLFGGSVYEYRKKMGCQLAKEAPVDGADLVIAVPDSGTAAAIGYAQEAGLPLELGLVRSHYVGRTFIEPAQSIRNFGVKIKLSANKSVIRGKSIVVIDDSIVRGTTSKKLVSILRKAGAKAVHFRISSPPITDPCFYGIDTPEKDKLIASSMSIDQIKDFIGVDSLAYLSREGLFKAVGDEETSFCDACFTGAYPAGVPKEISAPSLFSIKK